MAKILLVDDDRTCRRLLRATFGDDHAILEAADGAQAVAVARQERPDLVVLDVRMPTMNGLEACARIKAGPETRHAKVILLTAHGSTADHAEGTAVGADAYITKPYSPLTLVRTIEQLLSLAAGDPERGEVWTDRGEAVAAAPASPSVRSYGVFISHAWRHDAEYDRLVGALRSVPSIDCRIVSSPQRDPSVDPDSSKGFAALRDELDAQIRQAACVLVVARTFVDNTKWVRTEITQALRYAKPIVGIVEADEPAPPRALATDCREIVGWDPEAIAAAIRRHAQA